MTTRSMRLRLGIVDVFTVPNSYTTRNRTVELYIYPLTEMTEIDFRRFLFDHSGTCWYRECCGEGGMVRSQHHYPDGVV
jgi:hypothetical protein